MGFTAVVKLEKIPTRYLPEVLTFDQAITEWDESSGEELFVGIEEIHVLALQDKSGREFRMQFDPIHKEGFFHCSYMGSLYSEFRERFPTVTVQQL